MNLAPVIGSTCQKLIGSICKHRKSPFKVDFSLDLLIGKPETGCKMPVFHTKTIESILEPVAQQVSDLFSCIGYRV